MELTEDQRGFLFFIFLNFKIGMGTQFKLHDNTSVWMKQRAQTSVEQGTPS